MRENYKSACIAISRGNQCPCDRLPTVIVEMLSPPSVKCLGDVIMRQVQLEGIGEFFSIYLEDQVADIQVDTFEILRYRSRSLHQSFYHAVTNALFRRTKQLNEIRSLKATKRNGVSIQR